MTDDAKHSNPTDQAMTPQLVIRLRAGDSEAGKLLDTLYREAIIRFCTGYLGQVERAEDATQEVFCKVLATDRVPDNFRAYLYRSARNHCLNVIRDDSRHKVDKAASPSRLPTAQTGHLTKLVRQEQHSRLAQLVDSLSTGQREALRLRYTEGLSRGEIAEVLEVAESVVKSRLFEGLKKLREHPSLLTHL